MKKMNLRLLFCIIIALNGTIVKSQIPELWGTTYSGSTGTNSGKLYKINSDGTGYTVKHVFDCSTGCAPIGGLIQGNDGRIYGITASGGSYTWGVLYCFDPITNIYTDLHDFNPFPDGAYPQGGITQASNGKLYGTTAAGGANGKGIIFCYDPVTANYSILHNFDASYGYPRVAMIEVGNKLFGMTSMNETSIFSFDLITNIFTTIYIATAPTGANFESGFIIATNGFLYGTMKMGGLNSTGVIFNFDTNTNTYLDCYHFDSLNYNNGGNPTGKLVETNNGNVYGYTTLGGLSNYNGTIFKFNPTTQVYLNLFQFTYTDGSLPEHGYMIQASDGNLYGTMIYGGTDSVGVIFKFDIANNTFVKLLDFNGANGSLPQGGLVELISTGLNESNGHFEELIINPNPANNYITLNMTSHSKLEDIEISDHSGRQIHFEKQYHHKTTIDISFLEAGIYFLKSGNHKKMFVKI